MSDTTDSVEVPSASIIQQRVSGIFLMGMVSYANLYSFKITTQRSYRLQSLFWSAAAFASVAIEIYYFLIVAVSDMALRGIGYEERFGVNAAMIVFGFFSTVLVLLVRFFRMRVFVSGREGVGTYPEDGDGVNASGVGFGYYMWSLGGVIAIPFVLAHVITALMATTDSGDQRATAMTWFRVRALLEATLHLMLDIAFYNKINQMRREWTSWGLNWKTHFGLSFQALWSLLIIIIAIIGFVVPAGTMVIDFYLVAIAPTVDLLVFLLVNDKILCFVRHGGNFRDGSVWESEKKTGGTTGTGPAGSATNIATAIAVSQTGSQAHK